MELVITLEKNENHKKAKFKITRSSFPLVDAIFVFCFPESKGLKSNDGFFFSLFYQN